MSPTRLSKVESAMRVVLAFHDAFNRHDLEGMMRLTSDDCRLESSEPGPDGTFYLGKEAVAQLWQEFIQKSPEAHSEIEEIFGLGKRCIMRWRCDRMAADGSSEQLRGVDIFRVEDDLIRERLSYVKG